jgi:hypothetical protein
VGRKINVSRVWVWEGSIGEGKEVVMDLMDIDNKVPQNKMQQRLLFPNRV